MQILNDFADAKLDPDLVATIGTYDGLHRGHQHLVGSLIAHAKEIGALSGLITFHPHPQRVLHPELPTICLTTQNEKTALLQEMGLDVLVVLRFTLEMSRTPARGFVRAAVEHLRMRELWVGDDFALGRHREGDVAALRRLAQELGFRLRVVEMVENDEGPISSTRIRALILDGRVDKAAELLGRPYSIVGKVMSGVMPGHQQSQGPGFSAFELAVPSECLLPADGTYAACASLGGQRHPAVLSIEASPCSNDGVGTVRAYLLKPGADLAGPDLIVQLIQRLRSEHLFDTEEQLTAYILRDIQRAERILDVQAGEPS
ncbi:MAG: bifunctional riboflavin kinase/FAD synthetase [Anaerolineae bacterium]|nr:bifunctional riboflavin kinase/FAD synthetase [Anaerolineae bacterium]